MMVEQPALISTLLREVMRRVEAGELSPLPWQAFSIAEAAAAFRHMAQARHVGKVVLAVPGVGRDVAAVEIEPGAAACRADATYLVTGGLGGLGLTVAQWLVAQGARHLVLVGRNGARPAARAVLDAMAAAGATVVVQAADVSDAAAMAAVMERIDQTLPPLRGVIHAAGVLEDATLLQLDAARLGRVMAPKVQGAWVLHELTAGRELDFFVLFSSAAALLGAPGQGNYAAANAFLDALAAYRRAQGQPAVSIAWGPWAEVGLAAAAANRGARLAARGIGVLRPQEGTAALGEVLRRNPVQVAVGALNLRQWVRCYPAAAAVPRLAALVGDDARVAARAPELGRELAALGTPTERAACLLGRLREELGRVLQCDPNEIAAETPLRELGLDSLMAVELENRLEAALGVPLSATLFFTHPTPATLVPALLSRLGFAEKASAVTNHRQEKTEIAEVRGLPDWQASDLLTAELDALSVEFLEDASR